MIELEATSLQDAASILDRIVGEVQEKLARPDYMPALRQLMPVLETAHREWFATETAPNGKKWPALAGSTIKRKGHSVILIDTHELYKSLTQQHSESIRDAYDTGGGTAGITFGTSVEYARYHQAGTNKMPARPPVGVSDRDCDVMANTIADYLVKQLKG